MPCQELVCFGIVESIHWQTVSSAFLCLFSTALEHLLTCSIEVNLDKLFVFISKSEKQVDLDSKLKFTSKNIASLKFGKNLYIFAVVFAKERETKYFYFNLFFDGEKLSLITTEIFVTLISLARVLSCIINRLNSNSPFSDLTSYGGLFLQINYSCGG